MKHLGFVFATAFLFCSIFVSCTQQPEEPEAAPRQTTLEDLEGRKVAVVTTSTNDLLMTDNMSDVDVHRYNTPDEVLAAVENDSVEYGVSDEISMINIDLEALGLQRDFDLPGGFNVAAAFPKKDTALCRKFNQFLAEIRANGVYDEMFARWGSKRLDTVQMPEFVQPTGVPIHVITILGNRPLSFLRDEKLMGLEPEMMLRFGQKIGRPVYFRFYDFDEIIPAISAGNADVAVANIFVTPYREDRVLFSDAYYLCKTVCFSKTKK